jgi:poly-gamma-glutamate capsule biosynthesis protein CapA/YwtB (metallophosphatase superfamily)
MNGFRRHFRPDRREFLGLATAGLAGARLLGQSPRSIRVVALGQSLVLHDAQPPYRPGYADIREAIAVADIRFSNLEAAIRAPGTTPAPSQPGRVVAGTDVLDFLKGLSINLLSLSNNHADNNGAPGFLTTIEETRRRGFGIAGTGATLAEAAAGGTLISSAGSVALVAMASGAIPSASFATGDRVGVNHVTVRGDVVDSLDAERVFTAIRSAGATGARVIVYQHDHYWAPDWQDTPTWKQLWCRACIDAGASIFISHGVPILHGIEIYQGRPIFYGLGNFIFHAGEIGALDQARYRQTECWQSVVADCEFQGGRVTALRLRPITLKSDDATSDEARLHGNPRFADAAEAASILQRLRELSKPFGADVVISGQTATVRLAGSD